MGSQIAKKALHFKRAYVYIGPFYFQVTLISKFCNCNPILGYDGLGFFGTKYNDKSKVNKTTTLLIYKKTCIIVSFFRGRRWPKWPWWHDLLNVDQVDDVDGGQGIYRIEVNGKKSFKVNKLVLKSIILIMDILSNVQVNVKEKSFIYYITEHGCQFLLIM